MNNYSTIRVEIGGKHVGVFSRVSIRQWIDRHHTVELHVPIEQVEGAGAMKINQSKEFISKEILITITDRPGGGVPFVFRGFVTQLYLSKQAVTGSSVVIRGFSASILLEQGTRYAAFYQKNHTAIVSKVLAEYDQSLLRPQVSPRNNQPEDYVVKFDESSYNFLHRLAAVTGNWFYFDGEKTSFGDVPGGSPIELEYGKDIGAFEMRMDLPGGNFFIKDFNYRSSELVKSHSKDVNVSGLGEYGQFLIDKAENLYPERTYSHSPLPVWTDGDAKQQVGYEKKASVASAVIFSGSSSKIGLKLGSVIDIKESTSLNTPSQRTESLGQYRIIAISHDADNSGGYSNRFEAVPAGVEFRASPAVEQPRTATQLAKVTHNDDPDHIGRVRVLFLWQEAQGDTESSTWVRVLEPYLAHPDQGHYFVPEKNTLVMVDFENGDPARPLVTGSMRHHATPMNKFFSDQNHYKVIVTKGGNHIVINDEAGKEEISFYDKDKKNHVQLSLNGGVHINLKSQGTINLDAGEINMTAKNIHMKASADWKVEANQINMDSESGLFAKAGGSLRLTGDAQTVISGGAVKIASDSTAEIDGKQTAVKGSAELKLAGGAHASLKAALVEIN